jgi:hypothetical protein
MALTRLHELGDSTAAAEIQEHLDQVTQSPMAQGQPRPPGLSQTRPGRPRPVHRSLDLYGA